MRNGDITERRLAKVVGVSQPHMHNVLKGARLLTPALADDILQQLRLSLLDLVGRDRMSAYLAELPAESLCLQTFHQVLHTVGQHDVRPAVRLRLTTRLTAAPDRAQITDANRPMLPHSASQAASVQ